MTRLVNCKKYKTELEGLEQPPFPGAKGVEVFETVSKKAWFEWLDHQKMLINEKQLNVMDIGARTYLNEQRDKFLADADHDSVDGYIPENDKD